MAANLWRRDQETLLKFKQTEWGVGIKRHWTWHGQQAGPSILLGFSCTSFRDWFQIEKIQLCTGRLKYPIVRRGSCFLLFALCLHFLHKVNQGNMEFYFLLNPGVNDSLLYLMYFSQIGQNPCHHLTLQILPWPPPWQQPGLQQSLQLLREQQRQMQTDQQGRPWPVRKSNQYFSFQFTLEILLKKN